MHQQPLFPSLTKSYGMVVTQLPLKKGQSSVGADLTRPLLYLPRPHGDSGSQISSFLFSSSTFFCTTSTLSQRKGRAPQPSRQGVSQPVGGVLHDRYMTPLGRSDLQSLGLTMKSGTIRPDFESSFPLTKNMICFLQRSSFAAFSLP